MIHRLWQHVGTWTLLAFVASTLMLLAVGSGCSHEDDRRAEDGRVIVHYWEKWTGFEGDAMRSVVDEFNASQDDIYVKMLQVSQIDQKLILATAGGNPPDVAGLWTNYVNVFAEKSALTPLDGYLRDAEISREDYIPVFWDLCEHRGFMWALPSTPSSTGLHWNKRLFREAGLDPDKPPQSIEELDAIAEQLTVVELTRDGQVVQLRYSELADAERRDKRFKIIQMGYMPSEPGWWDALWPYWFGGDLWDDQSQITAVTPANIEAYRWYRSYAEKYGVGNLRTLTAASSGNFASPQNLFLAERVAMVNQGVWMYNFIDKYSPYMSWGAAAFPSVDPVALPDVSIVESDVLVIPRGAKHPDEAFEFIRYVNSRPAMEKLCLGHRKFSPLTDVSPDFIDQHPHPYIQVFLDLAQGPNARYVPRIPIWNEYNDELVAGGQQLRSLETTPESMLEVTQDRMQWKMDRILRRWGLVQEDRMAFWTAQVEGAR